MAEPAVEIAVELVAVLRRRLWRQHQLAIAWLETVTLAAAVSAVVSASVLVDGLIH